MKKLDLNNKKEDIKVRLDRIKAIIEGLEEAAQNMSEDEKKTISHAEFQKVVDDAIFKFDSKLNKK